MRNLIAHYAALSTRMGAVYLFLATLAVAAWWAMTSDPAPDSASLYVLASPSLIGWITLVLVMHVGSLYHLHFRPETLQVQVARIRNRSLVMGSMFVWLVLMSVAYTLPYLFVLLRVAPYPDLALLSAFNMMVFNLFVVFGGFGILRLFDGGNLGTIGLVSLLFVVPNILNMVFHLGRPEEAWVRWVGTLLTNHINVLANPDMLLVREIQDMDVLLSTLALTLVFATVVFHRFRRADLV